MHTLQAQGRHRAHTRQAQGTALRARILELGARFTF